MSPVSALELLAKLFPKLALWLVLALGALAALGSDLPGRAFSWAVQTEARQTTALMERTFAGAMPGSARTQERAERERQARLHRRAVRQAPLRYSSPTKAQP